MRLTVTSLEDRTVPAALGGLSQSLGHLLTNANPTDVNKLLTDVQSIVNRQEPATQFPTLLSDAQALAAAAPTAAKTAANNLVTTIQTAEADGQITRQEEFNIRSAAQTVLKDVQHNSTTKSEVKALNKDMGTLQKAFKLMAADRNLIRSDIKAIKSDSLHKHH